MAGMNTRLGRELEGIEPGAWKIFVIGWNGALENLREHVEEDPEDPIYTVTIPWLGIGVYTFRARHVLGWLSKKVKEDS